MDQQANAIGREHCSEYSDFEDIQGQEYAKRVLEIAAAGGHHVLLTGSTGVGKTTLATALGSILPDLQRVEKIEETKQQPANGQLTTPFTLVHVSKKRPFRAPHNSITLGRMTGEGNRLKQGEIALADRGVVLLDELAEYKWSVLRAICRPMVDRELTISNNNMTITVPARFILIATLRYCPCGFLEDEIRPCICTPAEVKRYQKRVPAELMGQFDLVVEIGRVPFSKLNDGRQSECSDDVKKRVGAARRIAQERLAERGLSCNAEMAPGETRRFCLLNEDCTELMKVGMRELNLTVGNFHGVLKVARTIADLAGAETIGVAHVAEALQYRPRRAWMQ